MLRRLLLLLPVLAIMAALTWFMGQQKLTEFGERPLALDEELLFEVAPGTPFRSMVRQLEAQGAVDEPLLFRLYARQQGGADRIHVGEYQLIPGMTYGQLFHNLVEGEVVQRQVTFVEGMRVQDFLDQLASAPGIQQTEGGLTPEKVADLLDIEQENPEGWIYPDTYSYIRGSSDLALLRRAHLRMRDELARAWDGRAEGLPLDTPYEALILASIVEKETAVASERAAIAGVFVRRLERGMRLQTDPTVIYGLGDEYTGNITRAHLRRETPYNTYRINGLPPSPIAAPGRAAIEAVLDPAPGNALYFVAKGDGHHHFSATLDEHNRAVRRYQQRARRQDYRSVPNNGKNES